MTTISNLPPELLKELVIPNLGDQSALAFRGVCKQWNHIAAERFKSIQTYAFPYGTLAKHEENVQELGNRIKATLTWKDQFLDPKSRNYDKKINEALQNNPRFVNFDERGNPILIDYHSFFNSESSFFQSLKAKYNFFRGIYHKNAFERVCQIFNQHTLVAQDLLNAPLDSSCPLQSLRNHGYRLIITQEESKMPDQTENCFLIIGIWLHLKFV